MKMNPKQQVIDSRIREKESAIKRLKNEIAQLKEKFEAEEIKKKELALFDEYSIRELTYKRKNHLAHLSVAVPNAHIETDFKLTYKNGSRAGWRHLKEIGGLVWDDNRVEWVPINIR